MTRGAALTVVAALLLAPAPARADDVPSRGGPRPVPPAGGETTARSVPSIDIRDLPPLPRVRTDEDVTTIAVVAAQQAEEDVVVGAAKREQSLGTVASAVTVIPGDRLRRFGYRTVAEALRGVAGLYVVDDRMVQRLGIRGLQLLGDFNTRVLVLVDGATVNEAWNQYTGIGDDLPISIDEVARIEIVRGPVSSVYGTNAFFGIINIVTLGADQGPGMWARATGGTFGTIGGAAGLAFGTVNRQLRVSLSWWHRAGETLEVPELGGSVDDVDGSDAGQVSLVAQFDGAFAQVRGFARGRELPFAPYLAVPGDERNLEKDRLILLELGYTRELSRAITVTARGYWNFYRYEDYLVYEPDPNFRDIGISEWRGGELRGFARLHEGTRTGLTAGVEYTDIHTESESFEVDDREGGAKVPKDYQTGGVYAELESSPLPWLGFSTGVRYDSNTEFEDRLSPRAALFLHKGDDVGLKLLFAQGFRNPSAYEAFFRDEITYTDNPDLLPETIRSYEVVLWGRPMRGLNARLSAFRWEMNDLIEQDVDEATMLLQHQNVASMRSQGVEVEAWYRDTRGWLGFGSVTVAGVERDGEEAANAPLVVAQAGLSTPLLLRSFHVSTELQVVSARRTRDPLRDAGAHAGWNAAIYFPDVKRVDVTIGVRNVIGEREEIPAQEDFDREDGDGGPIYVLPGEGREIYARLGLRY